MEETIERMQDKVESLVSAIAGRGASPAARRKTRLFLGIAGLIAANMLAGPVIGHFAGAILGLAWFFLVGLARAGGAQ